MRVGIGPNMKGLDDYKSLNTPYPYVLIAHGVASLTRGPPLVYNQPPVAQAPHPGDEVQVQVSLLTSRMLITGRLGPIYITLEGSGLDEV